MLERLTVERERHDRHRNLVVAATGTGRRSSPRSTTAAARAARRPVTAVRRSSRADPRASRWRRSGAVLRDGRSVRSTAAGRIAAGRHVFAMIQSLQRGATGADRPGHVRCCHCRRVPPRSGADIRAVAQASRSTELLGLTATPERLDGEDVTSWFDHRIAVELRLWEAIDQGFLVPFQYFGVADGTDLCQLVGGAADMSARSSSNLSPTTTLRVAKLLEAIRADVLDPGTMRALGFCVSKEHARYMARKFTQAGLESVASPGTTRHESVTGLAALRAVGSAACSRSRFSARASTCPTSTWCSCSGRPRATVFTQQLGRGLRRPPGRRHLTVIDLIGQHRREFRFERRLSALIDPRRGPLQRDRGRLPVSAPGCTWSWTDRASKSF